jgi:hypothetical protein
MAVKAIVWCMILGSLGGSVLFTIKVMNEDPGRLVGMAFGKANGTTVELHVVVTLLAPSIDPVPLRADGELDWSTWSSDHYDVRDAAGNAVSFRRNINSTVIKEHDVGGGLPDSYLIGELQQGTSYTFTYTPIMSEPEQYKYEFVAPSAKEPFKRMNFEPAY